jgi:uncharacterized GH25 family protein
MIASMPRLLVTAILGLLVAGRAAAHDFWIEPDSFTPSTGDAVTVRLLVGEHLHGDAVARPPATSLHRFVLVDANSAASVTLPGRAGADPAGLFRLADRGAFIVGFHGKPNSIELPAEKFNAYLKDEGLDAALALRTERGQLNQAGREIYSRCAKSLLVSGSPDGAAAADRALGFTLELVAERQPALLQQGDALPVRLLYEGRPLAGALVVARAAADPGARLALRSDADGRVLLPLSHPGTWMVKAVHMRPAAPGSGADWESLWASLSFETGAAH